jgi:hypothetical protein
MKTNKKLRLGIKLKKKDGKKPSSTIKKKKKYKSTRKKDEENILSKDIDVEEEMKELERINERGLKTRDQTNLNITKNIVKNLKFKPYKYKGTYLPYHLRWIFNNNVKTNEIVLIQEIEALEVKIYFISINLE